MSMKTVSATDARRNLSGLVDEVGRTGTSLGIVRHGRVAAVLSPGPQWNQDLSDTTNMAAMSGSLDFLYDEPDLYTDEDIITTV